MATATATSGVTKNAIAAHSTRGNILGDLKLRADRLPQGWNERSALSWQEFRKRSDREDVLLIDIRDETGPQSVPGAINIPMGTFMSQMFKRELVDEEEEVLIFCNTDNRSGMAVFLLRLLGYPNVRRIEGGYQEYLRLANCGAEKNYA
jgi:rhodanese-related sulfurtransferase